MVKIKYRLLLGIASLLFLPALACAQEFNVLSDTLLWTASSYTDQLTDTTAVNSSEFTSYGTSKVKWRQQSAAETTVFEFEVLRTEGDWSTNGYVIFHATRKSKTQTFKFERINNATSVTLSYETATGLRAFVFPITQVLKINN